MRNIFKYPALEWRRRDDYCVPQGPAFSDASNVSLTLAGSRLKLRAPRHNPLRRSVKQVRTVPGLDVLADPHLSRYGQGVMSNSHWGLNCLVRRLWAFYGPWMTGCKGELIFSVCVIGRFDEYRLDSVSFFNPKAFEMVLVRYLNERYGHHNWEDELSHIPRYRGPIDWRRHDHLPVPSASFKISRGADPERVNRPQSIFVFPVSDGHFVEVCFEQRYHSFDHEYQPNFDNSPLQELQDNIFNSITLELGPETQAKVEKIKAQVGDMQLCKEFAPLKWPTNIYPPEPSAAPETQKSLKAGC
ncbi:hypothetical protein JF535_06155 [Microbulbifer salipaludis]|uniref:Uncharacterized protein n=1 Tax=Microbulbifer salipaludis TaxID=187980 RepID=A0ABS3E558_9GAMM|nr:hypothetical protein [Microbulbifer salipaludis]MBN8430436.1 hypothetical protein [Microbulbifer salipaludis]